MRMKSGDDAEEHRTEPDDPDSLFSPRKEKPSMFKKIAKGDGIMSRQTTITSKKSRDVYLKREGVQDVSTCLDDD